jgi:hypothetical protein
MEEAVALTNAGAESGPDTRANADFDPFGDVADFDTADRLREAHQREPMHETRDGDADARNIPRSATADLVYKAPMSLDAPAPRPGYAQRWIRLGFRNGEHDAINVQAKDREGWRPRDPASVPKGDAYFSLSSSAHQSGGVIRVGNLVLHEIPIEILRRKKQWLMEKNRRLEDSVRHDTDKASSEGMRRGFVPIVREDERQVSTGRRPATKAN